MKPTGLPVTLVYTSENSQPGSLQVAPFPSMSSAPRARASPAGRRLPFPSNSTGVA